MPSKNRKSEIVEFNAGTLRFYLNFFDKTIDWLVNEITTEKTKPEKKRAIAENLSRGKIDFRDLKKAADKLKINVYTLYFENFKEPKLPVAYKRKNPNTPLSIDTYSTIQKYQELREDIACLEDDEDKENSTPRVTTDNDPREIALKYRNQFDYGAFISERSRQPEEIFKFLREKIEDTGVYVFKTHKGSQGGEILETLDGERTFIAGCTFINDDLPPLILINSSYTPISQIATLLHEFAHYILGVPEIEVEANFPRDEVEKWCHRFAYGFLIPSHIEVQKQFTKANKNVLMEENLNDLSEEYFVSKMSLMIRLKELDIVSEEEFYNFVNRYNPTRNKPTNESSGGSYHTTKKERYSKKFVDAVAENFYSSKISRSEAAKYLGISYHSVSEYI